MKRHDRRLRRLEDGSDWRRDVVVRTYNDCIVPVLKLFERVMRDVDDEKLRARLTREFADGVNDIRDEHFRNMGFPVRD